MPGKRDTDNRDIDYRDIEYFGTIVIGGGQAGLAVGHHLQRCGLPFVILDAGDRIGDSWRNRWDSLRVFTPGRYDGLPGMAFPGPGWAFPTKDEVASYLESYATQLHLPVRSGVRVDGLQRKGDRYIVAAGDVRLEADQVVVTTGAYQTPRIPAFATELDPGIAQLHSSAYRNPSQLHEGAVLVVGAGNSGAEIALEAARSGHATWLSGRDTGEELPFRLGSLADRLVLPLMWFSFHRVLTTKTRVGRKFRQKALALGGHPLARVMRRDLIAAGIERLPRIAGAQDGYPVLEDGRVMQASDVIWCTGFRPNFGWIDLPVFDEEGAPIHDRGVVDPQPGLYFVGQFFLHSLTSSLIGGVGRDAKHIASVIAKRAHARKRAAERAAAVATQDTQRIRTP